MSSPLSKTIHATLFWTKTSHRQIFLRKAATDENTGKVFLDLPWTKCLFASNMYSLGVGVVIWGEKHWIYIKILLIIMVRGSYKSQLENSLNCTTSSKICSFLILKYSSEYLYKHCMFTVIKIYIHPISELKQEQCTSAAKEFRFYTILKMSRMRTGRWHKTTPLLPSLP